MKAKQKRILVVDDEAHIRRILQVSFEKEKYSVTCAEDVQSALERLEEQEFDVVLTDVTMPGLSGYDLLEVMSQKWPETPVIIITAFGTIPQAVRAMRTGAFEYLTKPVDLEVLKKVVANAVEGTPKPKAASKRNSSAPNFIAESPAMIEVLELVQQVAESKATVLITGESGAGKEVIAKAIHSYSPRSADPFIAVSCAALPETLLESELFGYERGAFTGANDTKIGRFELAHNGTLFLDEIGEIPLATQVKLLRVLQEREFERLGGQKPTKVDVRLVTATNRNLQEAVEEGVFRLDLLYRLQVVEIFVPPLRERREDILPLARHFVHKFCKDNGRANLELATDTESLLLNHAWPGNVRELENTIERAVVLSPSDSVQILSRFLPGSMRTAA